MLKLNDVSDKTILFVDRSDRIVKFICAFDFINKWSVGEDNFAEDIPNTVLAFDEIEGQQVIEIIKVCNPIHDLDKKITI